MKACSPGGCLICQNIAVSTFGVNNTSIEANIYISTYARDIMNNLVGPLDWVLPTAEQATQPPAQGDFFTVPTRYGIQVSLFGYREVQQRGQYHSPGAIQAH